MKIRFMCFLSFTLSLVTNISAQISYPGDLPGKAAISESAGGEVILENNLLKMHFSFDGRNISITDFYDKKTGNRLVREPLLLFELKSLDGKTLTSNDFAILKKPVIAIIEGNPASTVMADRQPGKNITADLEEKRSGIIVHWEAELRDGSNYIRNIFRFTSADVNQITRITLIKLPSDSGAERAGTVDGSPLIIKNMFVALEYPLSKIEKEDNFTTISVSRLTKELSTVWGVTPVNQLRRGFLYYVERERAHPYHQVLHYNSWFDISWGNRKFDERESLDRIRMFGDSLINGRNVHMTGFLFDDGWDDNRTLWKFHSGFPEGFINLKKAAESYNSDVGVWMSPFGGYGEPKNSRIEYGNKQNPPFETNANGFSLSGPVYYNRFKEVTSDFIRKYDISMFKFDGVGAGIGAGSGDLTVYRNDVESFLKLLGDLPGLKPDIYLSLTTGTWPSVYWLKYGDNIWRGGDDTNMMGEGSKRQKWITYRDADTYKNIVKRGPLYPLNSLMLCGICIADNGNPGLFEMNDKDISDEIWSFFATGTNLQELYINPHKLNTANWDCLAAAAGWAKENETVMTDIHWVGGDPGKGEVYGFAAWSEGKSLISLRNPSEITKDYSVDVAEVFELPAGVNNNFLFYDVKAKIATGVKQITAKGKEFSVTLQPFEVKIYDAEPQY
ncbi:MAG: hypothetical protein A2X03_08845 [Bacteroidetes bacterium GWA2_40_15]|nr:MAG: hypothetical protein A2X03_08845 [Bacteroidetes bacterium GWA2_40_15]OFX87052.1 MAG: hypothetical protein A2X06_03250 [Bacteroidetes bacterium GWC2_40_22]